MIEKHPLIFEKAFKYVREQLQDGNALALELLNTLNFTDGHFFALLNNPIDLKKIHSFKAGGILVQNSLETVLIHDKIYLGRLKPHSSHELALFLQSCLTDDKCCFFEDVVYKPTDKILNSIDKFCTFYRDEVFLYLNKNEFSIELAEKIIRHANGQWYYLNVISLDIGVKKHITSDQIHKIALQASHIIVGAYDMEGFVIWEKHSAE